MANAVAAPRDPTAVLGRRIAAYLIDVALVAVIGIALVVTAYTRFYGAPAETCPGFIATAGGYWCLQMGGHLYVLSQNARLRVEGLTMLAGFLDLVVLQAFTGASVGKHCLGLRVVDENGLGPSFLRTLARWLLLIVDSGCFLVGLVTAATTHMHQRVGDIVCHTYVVDRSRAGRPINTVRYQVPRSGAATAGNPHPPNGALRRPSRVVVTAGAPPAPVAPAPRVASPAPTAPAPRVASPPPRPRPAPVAPVTPDPPAAAKPRRRRKAAAATAPVPGDAAAPRKRRKARAAAAPTPGDAAEQWKKPPKRGATAPSPKPAPPPGESPPMAPSAAQRGRARPPQPRWSPVAAMPPLRGPVDYPEPDPRDRPNGR